LNHYLHKEKGIAFDTLSSSEAHRLFGKFCRKWNHGRLSSKYYAGTLKLSDAGRSSHRWGFASKFDEQSKLELDSLRERVARDTQFTAGTPASASLSQPSSASVPARLSRAERDQRWQLAARSVEGALEQVAPTLGFDKGVPDADEPDDFLSVDVNGNSDADLARLLARERRRRDEKASVKRRRKSSAVGARQSRDAAALSQLQTLLPTQAVDASGRAVVRPRQPE
jgi:hypothetical protein